MTTFKDFKKPLDIKEIKKNFRNKLKDKTKDEDRPYYIYTEDEFYYYMKDIIINNKKTCSELKNKFTSLTYKSKNNCLEIHNKILNEILKYPKSNINDLMDYYYDHYNFPKYLKTLEEINKRESYDIIYSFDFLNEKQLRNILFQFYFN